MKEKYFSKKIMKDGSIKKYYYDVDKYHNYEKKNLKDKITYGKLNKLIKSIDKTELKNIYNIIYQKYKNN
jgi:hypothetical protein